MSTLSCQETIFFKSIMCITYPLDCQNQERTRMRWEDWSRTRDWQSWSSWGCVWFHRIKMTPPLPNHES